MPPVQFFRSLLKIGFPIFLVTFSASCGKSAHIRYQAQQVHLELSDLQAQGRRLDAEVAATGDLGRYQSTNASHVAEMKNYLGSLKNEIAQLKAERDMVKGKNEAMKEQVASYRARFRGQ